MIIKIAAGIGLAYLIYIVGGFLLAMLIWPWVMNLFNGHGYWRNFIMCIPKLGKWNEERHRQNFWEGYERERARRGCDCGVCASGLKDEEKK